MRVVIAEDNVLLSAGLELILGTKDIEVAAVVTDGPGLLDAAARHRPDALIVDVRLPPSFRDEGIRAALAVRRAHPGLPVLVLSQYVERVYAHELLADGSGGVGYLLKDRVSRVGEFVDALHRVARGGTVMDPEVVDQLMTGTGRNAAVHAAVDALTPREREVLTLMARGLGNREIGERLVITDNAVHKHIGNIFAKLGLPVDDRGHRRVLAVLTYLDSRG
ncbi:response regulator transcription factor [Streptomyces natalensis]|uniref:LuxR family transcriptional regulator n=1 Tax=Streptomyces natalensis ATCC 27448 TaxID=1240678 RepID=A0A0D7CW20_9ACTN|nr:response regulator transcription factor [Streptomyces natalensis]KIZ19582.1 LuxR family transcriptional regulator [Streptomyces natalensis ATCC 27448]